MKSTFLFLVATTMMTCTALGQSSNDKERITRLGIRRF